MGAFLDFGALLSGITSEAATIRQERQQQENDNFLRTSSILNTLIQDEAIPEETKAQARQAMMDISMEHLGYTKKSKQTNPVRKAIEGLVGQVPNDFSGAMGRVGQPGVGSGNAKTSVGTMPPQQDASAGSLGQLPQMPAELGPVNPFGMTSGQRHWQNEIQPSLLSKRAQIEMFMADPVVQQLKEKDPNWFRSAYYKTLTGTNLEGSANPVRGDNRMTVKQFLTQYPENAGMVAGLPETDFVVPFFSNDGSGKVLFAQGTTDDPTRDTRIGTTIQVNENGVMRVKQWNPETQRYDIDAGEGRPANETIPGSAAPFFGADGRYLGSFNAKTGTFTPPPPELADAFKNPLASTEVDRRTALTTMIADMDKLDQMLQTKPELADEIGFHQGRWADLRASGAVDFLGIEAPSDDVVEMFRLADNAADMLLRARSGAQINEQEYSRLRPLVPDPRTRKETFMQRLKSFRAELDLVLNTRLSPPLPGERITPTATTPTAPSTPSGFRIISVKPK